MMLTQKPIENASSDLNKGACGIKQMCKNGYNDNIYYSHLKILRKLMHKKLSEGHIEFVPFMQVAPFTAQDRHMMPCCLLNIINTKAKKCIIHILYHTVTLIAC